MTREEIRAKTIEQLERVSRNIASIGETEDFTSFAIETLNQEPCEDCVSRAELKKWLDMNFSFGGALRKLELFDRLDKELPSVNPTSNLDKVKADTENLEFYYDNGDFFGLEDPMYIAEDVLAIIDKYKKAERGDKE